MTAFRLAHISDLQLPPPALPFRWRDVASKRLLSRFAWRRKQRRHLQSVLNSIAADIVAHAPDHLAITGDVINFATPEEFAAARDWLHRLGPPDRVTISPGNHDALAVAGAPRGFGPWREWLGDSPDGDFPHLRVRGPVALINLSSAVQTALHLAQGTVGQAQMDAAARMLRETGARGLYRVVLLHHPVAPGVVAGRKALTDAGALQAVLAREGAELILHGHAHEALLTRTAGPNGPIPILAVPAASTPADGHGEPARWNEITIDHNGGSFRTTVRARGINTSGGVEHLGEFRLV